MIDRRVAAEVLELARSTGGDFSELFVEDTTSSSMLLVDGRIDSAVSGRSVGAGVRIYQGTQSVYAYTNDISRQGLLHAAEQAASALGGARAGVTVMLGASLTGNRSPVAILPVAVRGGQKADLLKAFYASAKSVDALIAQVTANYIDCDQRILVANSEGVYAEDRRVRTRAGVQAVASDKGENQTGSASHGAGMGFELYGTVDPEEMGKRAGRCALTMLKAEYCKAGVMPVVIENGFGGVIFHEACGHSLEATGVAKGNSEFCGKLGQQIASPIVTAIDDGTIPNAWGSLNIDDEGRPTQRNVLIENGMLTSYMIDQLNGRRMGMAPTGNARRQSYAFAPTSRMTNTFIAAGTDDDAEMIASLPEGLYAKQMGGGSVNPITGEFNFAVLEGYLIKNGAIDRPVRGATLIGKGGEVLLRIDRVGKHLARSQGMCGSVSGSIPTDVGQPCIRVSEVTVGGR